MANAKRSQKFVDASVQGTIMWRTTMYWLFCMGALSLVMIVWRVITQPAQPFAAHVMRLYAEHAPVFVASLLLLPILLIDAVALTNRFAGPAVRLRRAMRQLADGEPVEPVRFRKHDFWHEFSEDFNRVVARIEGTADTRPGSPRTGARGEPDALVPVRG
jgi:hypothetical protein